jgi:hypothetical protein
MSDCLEHKPGKRWSQTSKRALEDMFAPPDPPRNVKCQHCDKTFMSNKMRFGTKRGMYCGDPLWWCPTESCPGAGYNFDIFDVDEP